MSDAEDEKAMATKRSNASTSSSQSQHDRKLDDAKTSNGKEGERATANQPATSLSTALVPRVERESSVVPRDEHQRGSVNNPLPVLTSSLSPHDVQPATVKTSSGKEVEQATTQQLTNAMTTALLPYVGKWKPFVTYRGLDRWDIVEKSLVNRAYSSLTHEGQPDTAEVISGKESEQAHTDQTVNALTSLPRREGQPVSSAIPSDDQRVLPEQPSAPMLTPHERKLGVTDVDSGEQNRPVTADQPVTIATMSLPPREGQKEAPVIPSNEYKRSIVDQPTRAPTFSPHDSQTDSTRIISRKGSKSKIANKPFTVLTSLPPHEGQQESTMASSDKEQRAVVDQPFTALRVLLSSHDSQLESAELSSGKDSEQATTKQPTSALTTSLPSRDDRHESVIIPSDEGATVSQPSTTLTSFLLSQDGRHREGFKMAATRGTEDERLAIHNASVKPTYERTSSLSSTEGHQEAARTSTVAAVMTAASVAPVAPTSPLDHVLICGHGRFQQIALFCTALAFFTTIVHAIASANLARPVDHWCRPTVQYSYMEPNVWRNISIPVIQEEGGTERRSQCQRFEPPLPYAESSAGLPDNRSTVPCDAGWQYASGASSAHQRCNAIFAESHGHSIVDEWDLVCGRSWMVPALSATYVAGGVVGAPLAGIAADRIGRRPVLGIWLVLLVFAGTALVFANSVAVFAALRFVTSAGAAGVLVASQVLLFEVTDSQHHVLFCAIAVAAAAFVAAVYTEVVYVFIRNWHAAQVAYMVPTCGLMVVAYLAEESPCWLMATYELRNAEHVLSRAAGANRVEPPVFRRRLSALRDELCRQHCHSVTQQEQERANVTVTDPEGVQLSDLLSNQPLRQRSAVIFGCWFLAFGTFAHLSTSHMMRTSQGARAALVVSRLPCVVADVYVLTRKSTRLCLVFSMLSLAIVMGALSLAVSLDTTDLVAAVLVTLALLVFDMSAISAFVLSAELYPTMLRGATFGVCYMSGRLGALAAVFVNEIQSRPLRGVAYAVTAAMLLLFGTMALALPETKNMPPSNTVHGIMVMEDKWQLYSPLRVARTRNKRRHSKTALLESDRMRRRSSSLLREQDALGRDQAAYK
ncbi:hypothetical protein MRX96_022578 [Rhipicephalus microplus]